MKAQDIVTRVQRSFGDQNEALIEVEDILRWINDGQLEIVRQTECLQKHAKTSSIAGDNAYDLPDDFVSLPSMEYAGRTLMPSTKQEMDTFWRDRNVYDEQGAPDRWYIWGKKLYVYPIPSTSGDDIELFYVRAPATVVNVNDDLELPDRYRVDLVKWVLAQAKELDEDDQKATSLMAEFDVRMGRAKEEQQTGQDSYPAIRVLPGDEGYVY